MSHVFADAPFCHRHSAVVSCEAAPEARHRRIDPNPRLANGECVLRRSHDAGEDFVATSRALYERTGDDEWQRFAWADVAVVGWSRVERAVVLRLWPTCESGSEVRITGDAVLAAFVDERVAAARVLTRHVRLKPGVIGTVVAVRDDDYDVIRWQLLVAGEESSADPELREIGDRVIAEIRAIAGC